MAKKKLGSTKSTDEVLIYPVNLATESTGLPAAIGGLAYVTWGAPSGATGGQKDIIGTIVDAGTAVAITVATGEVEVMVSDSATDAEPSAVATLSAHTVPAGTILSGSGTATMNMRSSATGTFGVKVTGTTATAYFLWVRQGKNSQWWLRANVSPQSITMA